MTTTASLQETAARLAEVVGPVHVSTVEADRAAYGHLEPDAVAWPGSAPEIAGTLRVASELGLSVAVAGAGTRARHSWPAPDGRRRLALDTHRLTNILQLDERSLTVHSQTGVQLQHLEQALRRHGLTLGPLPRAMYGSTLGGVLADPPAVAQSPLVGRFADGVAGLSVALPTGDLLQSRVSPRKAVGPDLVRFFVGSCGALGVITEAVLRVHRAPAATERLAFIFNDAPGTARAARALSIAGVRPARMVALCNEQAGSILGGGVYPISAALVVQLDGPAPLLTAQRQIVEEAAAAHGGSDLPPEFADRWWRDEPDLAGQQRPVGARLPFAETEQLLALAAALDAYPVRIWLDQFSLQGANVWLGVAAGFGTEQLRQTLAAASLSPMQPHLRPQVVDRVRRQIDPSNVLLSPMWS